ncbi:DNA adenine methylase [Undibacterium sp. TJN25]|uniref:DNA adenine methylase n=1 Tax=Undibacterium sp. TJN25 TaxID=3413056 RepID=UPI003BF1C233
MESSPIIPWLGGKRRLSEKLIPLFPPHECYVEAFCGGAALFFLRPMPAKTEVINDVNGDLVNLYRVVQHHLTEFIAQFRWAINSREIFKWHQLERPETLTDIQRAARFYYLQQHAFSGKVASQSFGTATTSPAINLTRIEENLSAAHMRLGGVYVEKLAWEDCVKRYDRAHTFFYMDPPYWETEGYGVSFEFAQYERMAEVMRSCKGKVMVSINDHPDIRQAFEGFEMMELDIKYAVANVEAQRTSKELVIANWTVNAPGGLF